MMASFGVFVLLVLVAAAIDDENPDMEHFCVLDAHGNPVNCNVDDNVAALDDELVRSTMSCSGADKSALLTTCEFHNICFDARGGRPYKTVKEHEPHLKEHEVAHYSGERDWLYFSDAADVRVPPVELIAHASRNQFSANVTQPSLKADQVKWLEGTTVLIYRQVRACMWSAPVSSAVCRFVVLNASFCLQYLVNYYHVVMDDMVGIWWTMQNHVPHTPVIDEHHKTKSKRRTCVSHALRASETCNS